MLEFARLELGGPRVTGCSVCPIGSVSETRVRTADTLAAEITMLAHSWDSGPGPNVALAGAEAFSHPELPAIIAACMSADVERIRISTDAIALAKHNNARGALQAGVRHFDVTLLAGAAPTHDRLVGRGGAFAATVDGLQALHREARAADVSICVSGRVVACPHSLSSLPGAVAVLASHGAAAVAIELDDRLEVSQARVWLDAAVQTGIVNACWVFVPEPPPELLGAVPPSMLELPWVETEVAR